MSRDEKLIQKILARPPEADFSDVKRLLENFGWVKVRTKGSHHIFVHPERNELGPITVPIVGGRKVKKTYLVQIVKLLELEDFGD